MSFAQQKQRQYIQLSQTIQHIANELRVSRDLLSETSRQISAMGKFGALHAAQMMAVETVETHIEETGGLPYSNDSREEEGNNNQKTTSHADDDSGSVDDRDGTSPLSK